MKIALAQLNYHVGNFEANTQKIIAAIGQAEKLEADIVVFSELCICGYPARDFLEFNDFIAQCELAIGQIASHTHKVAALVGVPRKNPKPEGKDLFNSAFFLYEGKVQHITDKTLLPTYDVFDEYRYFEPNKKFETVQFKGQTLAITICEDIWDVVPDSDNINAHNPLYTISPLDEVRNQQPQIILNLSASPFSYEQHQQRLKVIQANVRRYNVPMVYVNQVGAQTELIFDGGSMVMNAKGEVVAQLPFFEEHLSVVDLNVASKSVVPESAPAIALIHDALVLGICDYFTKLGFKKAILGLSGGIDSALVLYLATSALGKENVLSLLMPSGFSSNHSVDDSLALCKNLDTAYHIVPIEENYQQFLATLQPHFKDTPFSVAEENIQARVRGVLLMAFSNKFGYILLNTTNKSEAAVGYGTLYGDMCGGLAVLGDVYKTQVYELARYINRDREIIPQNIITKAPSAELRPNQKDTDSLPEYEILDKILFQYIEKRRSARELITDGYDAALVSRVFKMVNTNEWKRFQAPPILRISPKAFGMGRRMNIEGKYY
ncbi:MAG: NAD+ synthase [Chitinophagales bacterium]|nr:NAD+ synthase [Chitinophagales bacterium]